MAYKRLGDILTEAKVISQEQLSDALAGSKARGHRLGEYLIEEGIITEKQLIGVLQLQLGVDFIDLNTTVIPMEMANVVPRNIARRDNIVPVKIEGDSIYLAMQD
ncbi:MAG: type II secretion system protein GspE, partial [Eubacteriales bacterium]|nr:type II secretion system protein GspE [Eubacteriales bacterium]